jgi:uncharacterized protein YndB with AHSA1/START domain
MTNDRRVVELDIRTTADALWRAITDPQQTRLYWYDALNHSTWQPGAAWTSEDEEGGLFLDGQVVAVEPRRRLVHTFHISEGAGSEEAPSTVSWEISQRGDGCHLRLTHEGLGPAALDYVTGGWEHILDGLKTLLETGAPPEPDDEG